MREHSAVIRLLTPAHGEVAAAPTLSDEQLALGAKQGQDWATRAIWDRYGAPLRRMVVRSLGPGADHDDVLQEIFLRVHRKLPELREPKVLRSFVFAIALNMLRMQLRRRKLRSILRLTDDAAVLDGPASAALPDTQLALCRLYRMLDRLTIGEREAFVLRYVEGFAISEIAELSGASASTVKRRLAAATERVSNGARADIFLSDYVRKLSEGGAS